MPYYLFRLLSDQSPEPLDYFTKYKEAKTHAYALRKELQPTDDCQIKIIFAPSQNAAEELLATKREAPILREDEK